MYLEFTCIHVLGAFIAPMVPAVIMFASIIWSHICKCIWPVIFFAAYLNLFRICSKTLRVPCGADEMQQGLFLPKKAYVRLGLGIRVGRI